MSEHGTRSRYVHARCRCEACTEANRAYQVAYMDRRAAELRRDPTSAPHGRPSTYTNYACRCGPCRDAAQIRQAQLRAVAP